MLELMGNDPYHFVMEHKPADLDSFDSFVHRTFNSTDLRYFIKALRQLYTRHGGLEAAFSKALGNQRLDQNIHEFRNSFLN